jgi:hypothetical protein
VDDLHDLSAPFTIKEIEGIVKHLKPDKIPGPYGFKGMFMKQFSPISRAMISVVETSLVGTLIVPSQALFQKKNTPKSMSDFSLYS